MPLQPAESAYLSLTVPSEHFRLFQGQACVVPESKDPHTHKKTTMEPHFPMQKQDFFLLNMD